jgi:hypothetical protein
MRRTCSTKLKILRLRLKDKHAKVLGELAREVNFVWNYCNDLQITVFNRERRFLCGYDFVGNVNATARGSTSNIQMITKRKPIHSHRVNANFSPALQMSQR